MEADDQENEENSLFQNLDLILIPRNHIICMMRSQFKFNLGDGQFLKAQQDWLLNPIYYNQQIFSLHNEDIRFCDKLTYTIPTTTENPFTCLIEQFHNNYKVISIKYTDTQVFQRITGPS